MTAGGWWGSSRGWDGPSGRAHETPEQSTARIRRELEEDAARREAARAGLGRGRRRVVAPCVGDDEIFSAGSTFDQPAATGVAWGIADPTEPVTCRRLITDAPIAVHRLGWLWAVDWDGTFSGATVQVGDHEWLWQVFGSL